MYISFSFERFSYSRHLSVNVVVVYNIVVMIF